MVVEYITKTHAKTHKFLVAEMIDILKVSRHGENDKFKEEIGNRMLLWHGTRLSNWVGILS